MTNKTLRPYLVVTSAEARQARQAFAWFLQQTEEARTKLDSIRLELESIEGDDPRRPIYLDAIKKMKDLIRGFENKLLYRECELRKIERKEARKQTPVLRRVS